MVVLGDVGIGISLGAVFEFWHEEMFIPIGAFNEIHF